MYEDDSIWTQKGATLIAGPRAGDDPQIYSKTKGVLVGALVAR